MAYVVKILIMSTLARFLMLVACVPLLLPSLFCICKADVEKRTSQDHVRVNSVASTQTIDGCSHHRCMKPVSTDPHSAPIPLEHHKPVCPFASAIVENLQWTESTVTEISELNVADFAGVPLFSMTPARHSVDFTVVNSQSSPPLYLSHCSFVI